MPHNKEVKAFAKQMVTDHTGVNKQATALVTKLKLTPEDRDPFPHTATAEAKAFDSREISEGRSWKLVVAKRGTFSYFCTLHRTMKGTLIVK